MGTTLKFEYPEIRDDIKVQFKIPSQDYQMDLTYKVPTDINTRFENKTIEDWKAVVDLSLDRLGVPRVKNC